MFNEHKAAQMAAFFLGQAPEKRMPHLKLMKLMYLAERESIKKFGWPIICDRLVSMPHGPVLSNTLNLMDGNIESQPGGWEDWISDKENHEVALRNTQGNLEFDELSQADIETLRSVWKRFGSMGKWEIRDWTHNNCAEWKNPNGSSIPIQYETLAKALGFNASSAKLIADQIQEDQEIDSMLAAI